MQISKEEYEKRKPSIEQKKDAIVKALNEGWKPTDLVLSIALSLKKSTPNSTEVEDWAIAFALLHEEHPETWETSPKDAPELPPLKPPKDKIENWLSFFRKFML